MVRLRTSCRLLIASLAALAAIAAISAPAASAAGGPAWALDVFHLPTKATPGKKFSLDVVPTNVGTTASSGQFTIKVDIPAGLTPTAMTGSGMLCVLATRTCTGFLPVAAGTQNSIATSTTAAIGVGVTGTVDANPPADTLTATATISGGGAPACGGGAGEPACVSVSHQIPIGIPSNEFGVSGFSTSAIDSSGQNVTQAGGHPWLATTSFDINSTYNNANDNEAPPALTADGRTAIVSLPPGFVGNSQTTPRCPIFLQTTQPGVSECPANTQIGRIVVASTISNPPTFQSSPVYNLAPERGYPAEFGFMILNAPQVLRATVRSDGTYGIDIGSKDTSVVLGAGHVLFTFWGQPSLLNGVGSAAPFIYNPTNCSTTPPVTSIAVDSWINPGAEGPLGQALLSDPNWKTGSFASPALTGCENLRFEPSMTSSPVSTQADTPSGFSFQLHVPQTEDVNIPATPPLRDAVVTLPQGMVVNPALAEGLQGCTDAQYGEHSGKPANCPESSKIGSLEITTPLLDHKLPGSMYIRQPDPGATRADGLYTLFLAVDDPQTGVIVKLRGSVVPNEQTGRLTTTFKDNPQLPFSDLDLSFKGGPRGVLINPGSCGSYATEAQLTPWAGEGSQAVNLSSSFTIDAGPGGGACPSAGFDPKLSAGSANQTAGASSAFTLRVTRADGEQNIAAIDATLPEGLSAKLAGVPLCAEGAAATGNCPTASQIGTTTVGAGAGANPLYVPQPGKTPTAVYLAGPYKGAPYSLLVKAPAQAGPFDLGNVVVRSAIYVNPQSAEVTVKSDPLPQILEGVPLAYRDIRVDVNRPDFTVNPTNCEAMSVGSTITSAQGKTATPSAPFQVGECAKLAFAPELAVAVKGGTKRGAFQKLKAVLKAKPGQANIAKVSVALPHSEFLEQGHINTVCTRVQFAAAGGNGEQCPKGSVYGRARAITPLLDQPLEGPVFLRSSSHQLPDLVAALHGQIDIDLDGRIDSVHGGIRNSFEMVPDAPVSKFVLEMKGGKKSLLVNSRNICTSNPKATVKMEGQNGKFDNFSIPLGSSCGGRADMRTTARGAGA